MNDTYKIFKKFIQFKLEEIWDCIKCIGYAILISFMALLAIGIVGIVIFGSEYLLTKYDWFSIVVGYITCVIFPAAVVFGLLVLFQMWITDNWKKAKRVVQNEKTK